MTEEQMMEFITRVGPVLDEIWSEKAVGFREMLMSKLVGTVQEYEQHIEWLQS